MSNTAVPQWMDVKRLETWLNTPVKECINKDDNEDGGYLSDLHRILVKTKDGDVLLIVKTRKEEGKVADTLKDSTMFRKEQLMYEIILPKIEDLLRNAVPGNFEPLSPKCYISSKDFLVMEDLSDFGFKMLDREKGLDLEQCLIVMRTTARYHAATVKLQEEDPSSMAEYQINFFSETSTQDTWNTCFTALMKLFIEELETWPADEWAYYVNKLRYIQPNYLKRVQDVARRVDSDFNVLIHGDLWINNMLFRDDKLRLVDFQLAQFTSFAIDLHLFLATSVKMDVRIKHRDTLFKQYHSILCNTMTALGCERKLPTLEQLHQEFARKSMYGVFGVICAAAVWTSDPNCGFDLDELMKGRTPGRGMYSDYFKQIIKWALPLADKMGAFD